MPTREQEKQCVAVCSLLFEIVAFLPSSGWCIETLLLLLQDAGIRMAMWMKLDFETCQTFPRVAFSYFVLLGLQFRCSARCEAFACAGLLPAPGFERECVCVIRLLYLRVMW